MPLNLNLFAKQNLDKFTSLHQSKFSKFTPKASFRRLLLPICKFMLYLQNLNHS
ncbi:hypothetical protein UNSWCS_1424 [Campylobacter concisus UNSWCS]|uniref:Uncharacterized protein n=1 Tax=Campylobacter concisus UNSWCS TaxID=1242968 RepID=U2F910_9BACT|nr:hypothetical protein UNSWCS_1424 [Campylobacter concisus UNSWCS]